MAGFGHDRKATGVHDRLKARAVVLKHGQTKIALACVDLVGFFLPNVEHVRDAAARLRLRPRLQHAQPRGAGFARPVGADAVAERRGRRLPETVEKHIVQAVRDADAAAQPVAARIGTVQAPELLHDSREPYVKHDELVALEFRTLKDDKPAGLVVQWNCHPETLGSANTEISADFVGYTVNALQDAHHCPVVYLSGTVGGLMSSLGVEVKSADGKVLKDGTVEKTERYGRLLAEAADRALNDAKPVRLTPLEARRRPVFLPLANKLYMLARQLGVFDREAFLWSGDPYKAEPADPKEGDKPLAVRTEVGYLRLGELEIAVIPGEIYPELVLDKVQDPPDAGADFPDAADRAGDLQADDGAAPHARRPGQRRDRLHHPQAAVGREAAVLLRPQEAAVRRGQQPRAGHGAAAVPGVQGAGRRKKELNHRGTENTEKDKELHFSVVSVPLWFNSCVETKTMTWTRRHLLGLEELSRPEIETILDAAEGFVETVRRKKKSATTSRARSIVNLFFEPSTRTRASFAFAAKRLGADTHDFTPGGSSVSKGETFIDTAKNIEAMGIDVVVVRHSVPGAPHLLAQHLHCGVVNAGDGAHEHPTQGLLDIFTIRRLKGRVEGLTVGLVGDIAHSRVARSNIHGLLKLGAKVIVCGPPTLVPPTITQLGVEMAYQLDDVLPRCDVVNVLRIQFERQRSGLFPSIQEYFRLFGVDGARLRRAKPDILLLAPGPINRGVELTPEVADGPHSAILEQVTNGLAVRMAVLHLLCGQPTGEE